MIHRDASTSTGQFADAVPEFQGGLFRDLNPPFATREREPEVLELVARDDAALGLDKDMNFLCTSSSFT